MTSPEYQAPTWVNEDDPDFIEGVSPDLGAGYLNQLSGAVEDHGQRLGAITPVVTYLNANAISQDAGDNRWILQDNAVGFAPAEATANALAGKQPLDADLTALAGLDSATAGTVGTDGAGWVKKTYAQLKTALGLVKGDVGLGNVDNTADTAKPVSTAQQAALDLKLAKSANLSDLASAATARTNLGLAAAAASGKLADLTDVTTTGAAVGRGVAVTQVTGGAATQFGLVDPHHEVVDIRDFGVDLTGVNDSTAGLQSAITQIASAGVPSTGRMSLFIPAGTLIVSNGMTGIPDGLDIRGAGRRLSQIRFTGTGTLFPMGTFSTAPSPDYWLTDGSWQLGLSMSDLAVFAGNPSDWLAAEGSRVAICIGDYGKGDLHLQRVHFRGFKYAIASTYGSDFDSLDDVQFFYNDVGWYLGPGSEQVHAQRLHFLRNRESIVIDGAPQGTVVASDFVDSSVADVVFEKKAAGTRFGLATAAPQYHSMSWRFRDNWHESGADGGGGRPAPPQHILVSSDDTDLYPRGVKMESVYLVSGGTKSTTNAFWRTTNGTHFLLDGIFIYGDQIKYVTDINPPSTRFKIRNKQDWGGNDLTTQSFMWSSGGFGPNNPYEDDERTFARWGRNPTDPMYRVRHHQDGNDRWQVQADGKLLWGPGGTTAIGDTSFARAAAGQLATPGELVAADFKATGLAGAANPGRFVGVTASGPPTSGAFVVGDFVLSQNGQFFACVAAGTPGTWVSPRDTTNLLAAGEETFTREMLGSATLGTTSGRAYLTYWTARRSESVSTIKAITASTAAGATPTLCRMGVYSIAADGAGTLVASTANDTTLFSVASTSYSKALQATFNKVAGQRYATVLLVVSAAAMPTLAGTVLDLSPGSRAEMALAPRLSGYLGAQTDLPSSFTDASLATSSTRLYSTLT